MSTILTLHDPATAQRYYADGFWRKDTLYSLLRRHAEQYDPAVRVRLLQGLFYSGPDYVNAQRAQRRLREEMLACMHQVDALVRTPEKAAEVQARGGKPVLGDLLSPASYADAAAAADGIVHAAIEYSATPYGSSARYASSAFVFSALSARPWASACFKFAAGVLIAYGSHFSA